MTRTRSVALTAAALMLLPTLLVVGPAAAEDVVPFAPAVPYVQQIGFVHRLFLVFGDSAAAGQPNCATSSLSFQAKEAGSAGRNPCSFPVGTASTTGPVVGDPIGSVRTFEGFRLVRSFNVSGPDSVIVHFSGSVPQGGLLYVDVYSGAQNLIGTATINGAAGTLNVDVPIVFDSATVADTFDRDQTIRVILRPSAPAGTGDGTPAAPATYSVDDTDTYVEIRSRDAVRVATWLGEPRTTAPKTLWRPVPNTTALADAPRMQLHFSVQSAFPGDAQAGAAPRFSVLRGDVPQRITTNGFTEVTGVRNTSLVDTAAGISTWTLATGQTLDYRGLAAGEYVLRATAVNQQNRQYTSGVAVPFLLSDQAVAITPFSDRAAARTPETTAHEVPAGSPTTYLLNVTNSGAARDTLRIDASFVTGSPPTGWSATVSGPNVRGRLVDVAPGATEQVAIAITPPAGASVGSSSIFRVNATSSVDPTAVSPTVTLTTTVGNAVGRDVGILAPGARQIDAGVDVEVPVHVWNRGTRPANITLELKDNAVDQGWEASLLQGGLPVQRVVVSNVPAGAIAEATLRVKGPASQAVKSHTVKLNATLQDAPAFAFERPITFNLTASAGIGLQLLEAIGGLDHVAEVATSAGGGGPGVPGGLGGGGGSAIADNVSGMWYRVWVTNTGRSSEDIALSVDSIDPAAGCGPFVPATSDTAFRFYARSAAGRHQIFNVLEDLAAGSTAEVYLWRPVDGSQGACSLGFVVVARGLESGTVSTVAAKANAENTGGRQAVLIEPVKRIGTGLTNEIKPHLVDIQNATERALTSTVRIGENASYRVRVTNAASWGAHTDASGRARTPIVNVHAEGGIARQSGWNVSIRPILDPIDGPTVGGANYSFGNEFGGRIEAWRDLELEVNVTPPSAANGTALAGTSGYFSLRAEMPGYDTYSTLELVTTIARIADVSVSTDRATLPAHAGEGAPALLLITNSGGAEANVTVRATIDPASPGASGWRVDPAVQNFKVAAFRNRNVALTITPPAGAGAGSTGFVNVVVEYTPNAKGNETLRIPVAVQPAGTLDVSATQTDITVAPGGFGNFTLVLRNRGNIPVSYDLATSHMPGWDTSLSEPSGVIPASGTVNVAYVLRAPAAVENAARFATIVRVIESGNENNFDAQALGVNILGGKAVPSVSAPILQKRVDRGGVTAFPFEVRNIGSAAGDLPLEARAADPTWKVGIQDETGASITRVRLAPNELRVLNVTVEAPATVPERTSVVVEATASSEDLAQASKAAFRADIHDYALSLALPQARVETPPGVPVELIVRVRNLGNDNDTLNLTAHLPDLSEWNVSLSAYQVRLEPGAETEVRATIRSPVDPLPSPRTYTFRVFAGTVGGLAVGLPRNESATVSAVVLPYRALDVDDDDRLEVAVDADGRAANGYERFHEVFTDGVRSDVVATSLFDGKTRFFLDVPTGGSLDGVADVWFDPEAVFAYPIEHAPDLNGDGTPEYLVDTDRDGRIDRAYDVDTDTYWTASEVRVLGDGAVQYVVDTSLDGRPDHYYDPAAKRTTRTQGVSGQGNDVVGLDTDNDGKVDKYYNYRTRSVQDARVAEASGFLADYWYFFALFGLVVLATIALLVVRRQRAH